MPESPFMPEEPSNDTAEDLTRTGERGGDRESRSPAPGHDASWPGVEAPDAHRDEPDADRLGYREVDEQRAYGERADRAGTEGGDA